MRLDEYLEAINSCPEEYEFFEDNKLHRLTLDYGVYNNFKILLAGDFEDLVDYLKKADYYEELNVKNLSKKHEFKYALFESPDEETHLSIQEGTKALSALDPEGIRKIIDNLDVKYNIFINLHPGRIDNGLIKKPSVSQERAIAVLINELSKYIESANSCACFTSSIPWRDRFWKNTEYDFLPKLVFYP